MADNSNIVKFKKHSFLNIGVVVFLIILIYTLYFVARFFVTEHIAAYEVLSGSIVQDNSYTALALRDESVVYASGSGIINYYASEGDRVSVKTPVYSLDESGKINTVLSSASGDATEYLTADNLKDISATSRDFALNYNSVDFYKIYDFIDSTNSMVREFMNTNALESLKAENNDDGLTLYYGEIPGIICYYTDGYESLTKDTVTAENLDSASYTPVVLENNINIKPNYPVYKIITDESWEIVFEVSDDVAEQLTEDGSAKVTFSDDGNSATGTVEIIDDSGKNLAVVTFTNSMERYADKRYLDIKLTLDNVTGLKIPNSAIAQNTFNLIPKEYATVVESSTVGFFVENEDTGNTTVETPSIYYESDNYYYVDEEDLPAGSIIIMPDSSVEYVVSQTDTLTGVYNINKGYAIFTEINILFKNSDYSIVESNTTYGLSQFDYIVLDADTVKDGEILK
ncbi:MAG: hypothetical protein K6G40_09465 [Eubacterium sp.]|nr:hypothetical protein [Eubacterium sp.]